MREIPATAPLRHAEVFVFRAPIDAPVRTSFGVMHDRPAVLLRVEDEDGLCGWGEAWCNFPSCGAEHRGRLLAETVLPSALSASWRDPGGLVGEVARKLRILRLQADEPGPMDQALACLDIALWDLAARRAGVPLHALLGDAAMTAMPAYASGINHPGVAETVARTRQEGYRAFKVKIGFGREQDEANIRAALGSLLPGERLAADANQAWTLEQALEALPRLRRYPLLWVEEPLACDRPAAEWAALAAASRFTLAAGENIRGEAAFDGAIAAASVRVVQPDVCKWGGLTGCLRVARAALAAGLHYCPHYLGGGIGLLASAHLLAAVGGDGLLEVDCNPNPLRELLAAPFPRLRDGRFLLSDAPGLGVAPDMGAVEKLLTFHARCR
ncbi:MAG: mandelate racemase/muconate lactonizing enzyme family protein [Desulfovibrio sp.]|uniref:mandelate racemase/muconate lactonizing enzyme family protein n=1 Tax=Desulfovibrio sp. TaxID=885 RepID=UPI0025C52D07|nr:mandelate racemase/muconate lactonizing enzyme family protein [Desulfovibrio sp.]MBS6830359.1 mandelate racemase/muconate lactonizing enzyme family protein [Desulfovibrio sp.]